MYHHPITITGSKGFQSKTGFREGLQRTIAEDDSISIADDFDQPIPKLWEALEQ